MDDAKVGAVLERVIRGLPKSTFYSANDIAEKMASIDNSLTKEFLLGDWNRENTLLYREVCKLRNRRLIKIKTVDGEFNPGIIDFEIEKL